MFKQNKDSKEIVELTNKFYRLMFELGLYNKFNRTYYINIFEKTNYGYLAKLYLEPGLSYTELQKNIGVVQENLRCIWIMKTEQFGECAIIKIVTQPIDKSIPFENPKIRPWELYLGLDFALDIIKNDCNEYCMFLLAGATGSGKTRFIYMILLAWIMGCAVNEVEIYLGDIAKNEYPFFQHVKHVRYYASELEQLYTMMKYIETKINKRKKVLTKAREQGTATNIKEYNAVNKTKLTYCYIVIDEASVIMPDKSDSKDEKEIKQEILDILKRISKIGRGLGIFVLIGVQKTVKDEIPSIIKNMSAVRISFRANDIISSEVIIGDSSAVGLADRYAIYSQNGGERKDYLFSPYLTTEKLKELLKPYEDKNNRKINLELEIREANEPQQPPAKVIPMKKKKEKIQHYQTIDTLKEGDFIDN